MTGFDGVERVDSETRANTAPTRAADRAALAAANGVPPLDRSEGRPAGYTAHLLDGVDHYRAAGLTVAESVRRVIAETDPKESEIRAEERVERRRFRVALDRADGRQYRMFAWTLRRLWYRRSTAISLR